MKYFTINIEDNGVATLLFDTPKSRVNVLSFDVLYELENILEELRLNKRVKMLFIESSKEHIFIAGADIKEIKTFKDERDTREKLEHGQAILWQLENLPYPTIAVIDGACLGGGLELAMACDYRIASNHQDTQIGLVEVSLGLIPGLAGTQRLPKLVGFTKALELMTASKRLKPDKALKLGLIDASVPRGYLSFKKEEFIRDIFAQTLNDKILSRRVSTVWYEKIPWIREGIVFLSKKAVLKRTKGHYPAPLAVIDLLHETVGMPLKEGSQKELDVFVPLATSQISKNLIELFFTSEALKKETFSTASSFNIKDTAVVGLGVMGRGIAWAFSTKDTPVRVVGRSMKSIALAMREITKNFQILKKRKRLTQREIDLKMDRVTHTLSTNSLKHTAMVIEAVSEDRAIKEEVIKELEKNVTPQTIIASNTSSLAISDLGKNMHYPQRLIGMHFFNPVSKMPLVEVIAGEKTSDETIASTVTLAKKLGKVPIKVKECSGFLVNRVLLPYMNECFKMFEEGEYIERMDTLLVEFGMPMGPFTLGDEVGIDIGQKVSDILYSSYGERMSPASSLTLMVEKKWLGKKSKKGFYRYEGKSKTLNEEMRYLQKGTVSLDETTVIDRAILMMVNEAVKCLEEGVVDKAEYLDMAMVLGIGFPAFRGGLLRYVDTEGLPSIVERLNGLSQKFGQRFTPTALLVEMAKEGKNFYQG